MSGKKLMDECAVKMCKKFRGIDGTSFFRFPLNPDRCLRWIEACERDDLKGKDSVTLHNQYRVCALHFCEEMYKTKKKMRLKDDAVPSFFIHTTPVLKKSDDNIFDLNQPSTSTVYDSTPERKCVELLNESTPLLPRLSLSVSDVATQTEYELSSTSPRIRKLKTKIDTLRKQNERLKKKLARNVNTVNVDDVLKIVHGILPVEVANSIKVQIQQTKKRKG